MFNNNKMNQQFKCQRCGFNTNRKDNLKRHLNRKTICKPSMSNVPIDVLRDQVNVLNQQNHKIPPLIENHQYICKCCKMAYKHKSSYNRHINISSCFKDEKKIHPKLKLKEKGQLSEILDSDFYDEYLTLKFEELKSQHTPNSTTQLDILKSKIITLEEKMTANSVPTLAELMSNKDTEQLSQPKADLYESYIPKTDNIQTNIQTNKQINNQITNNNTINGPHAVGDNNQIYTTKNDNRYQNNQHITNNIYINEFGNEDTKHITKKEWKKIIHEFYQAIPTLVKKVHIENQENQNVFIPSARDNYALVYEKDDWQFRTLTQVLEDIIVTNADRLYDFINENEGEIDERTISKLDTIMEQLENGDTLYKKYQREVKYLLLNNRNLIKDYYEKHYLKPLKHR